MCGHHTDGAEALFVSPEKRGFLLSFRALSERYAERPPARGRGKLLTAIEEAVDGK